MASDAKVYKARVRIKARKIGRDRKHRIAREGSTPKKEVFFGDKPAAAPTA